MAGAKRFLAILSFAAVLALQAWCAPPSLTFNSLTATAGLGTYNFSLAGSVDVTASIYNDAAGTGTFFMTVSPATASRKIPATTGLLIYVYKTGASPLTNLVASSGDGTLTAANTGEGSIAKKVTASVPYTITNEIGKIVPPGTYNTILSFSLYNSAAPDLTKFVSTLTTTVSITVPTIAELSVMGSGIASNYGITSQTLAFGNLSSATPGSVDLYVRANKNFNLGVSTTNGGRMKLPPAAGDTVSYVPYTLVVGGVTATLSTTTTPVLTNQPYSLTETKITATVTVGSLANAAQNELYNYTDSITFTLTAP